MHFRWSLNRGPSLTHNTVDKDEDKVEKDDEAESAQEDNTVDRVDLHPAFFQTTTWMSRSQLLDILQVKADGVLCN